MIKSMLAHIALSVPIFAVGWGAAAIGWAWAGALAVILYWLGRELAQSMRPGAPFQINWTLSNTLGLVPAALLALVAAGVITYAF